MAAAAGEAVAVARRHGRRVDAGRIVGVTRAAGVGGEEGHGEEERLGARALRAIRSAARWA